MDGEGVTPKTFIQSIYNPNEFMQTIEPNKIVDPPVRQLPMTADSVKVFFYSTVDTVHTSIFGFMNMMSTSVYNIALYFYNVLYIFMEAWFYHGPRWMPGFHGNAGMKESDICAKLIGTSSNLFEGNGSSMCKTYIHEIITERCSFTCLILVCLYFKFGSGPTYNLFHRIYNYKDYELRRQARETANEQSKRTKKKNTDIAALLQAMSAILRVDDTGFVSQLNALRNLLDDVRNEDVVENINWPAGRQWISQGYSTNRQMLLNLGNGLKDTQGESSDGILRLRRGTSNDN
jgi:hypothetical protein